VGWVGAGGEEGTSDPSWAKLRGRNNEGRPSFDPRRSRASLVVGAARRAKGIIEMNNRPWNSARRLPELN
jgi:hypothetical protein